MDSVIIFIIASTLFLVVLRIVYTIGYASGKYCERDMIVGIIKRTRLEKLSADIRYPILRVLDDICDSILERK